MKISFSFGSPTLFDMEMSTYRSNFAAYAAHSPEKKLFKIHEINYMFGKY